MSTDSFLHSKHRLKHHVKSPNTFLGRYNCGSCCFILFKFLKTNKKISTRVIKNKVNIRNRLHDHVVLKYKDKIIDPTYRQFLVPDYNDLIDLPGYSDIGVDEYHNFIFNSPFIFMQSDSYLKEFINNCEKLHKETYHTNLATKDMALNLISLDGEDITERYLSLL